MKNVMLGAAALLFTGVLFAQNTSTSNQSGNDQRVYVRQAGTLLNSTITQGNGSGSGEHRAIVLQRGSGNTNTMNQYGTNNQAYVEQGDDFTPPTNASSTINQGTNNTASDDNKARVSQHGGTGSAITITQDGSENEAAAHQDDSGSTITVTQNGEENKSWVQQYPFYASSNNTATINQSGEENSSWADQDGNNNVMNATQSGNNNAADQE